MSRLPIELEYAIVETKWQGTEICVAVHWDIRRAIEVDPVAGDVCKIERRRNHTIFWVTDVLVRGQISFKVAVDLFWSTECSGRAAPEVVGRERSSWCVGRVDIPIRAKHKSCE